MPWEVVRLPERKTGSVPGLQGPGITGVKKASRTGNYQM